MSLQNKLFYLLLLFLPTQLGLHFWPQWSYVIGRKIDYLSPTIYFTDVLIVLIIILSFKLNSVKKLLSIKNLVIVMFVSTNIYFSSLPYITAYKWLKILEYCLLGIYVVNEIDIKKNWQNIVKTLSIGIIFESLLCIAQFLNQSSMNGIFYWFGERAFTTSTAGIAKSTLNGVYLLRPYGTFPHPNVLGGYLATLLPLVLVTDFKPMKIKWIAFVLGLSTLFLSFSRTAFYVGFLGVFVAWFLENNKHKTLLFALLTVPVIFLTQNIALEKESIDRRISLNNTSIEMLQKKPLTGVGLGNYIPNLPLYSQDKEVIRFLQPAHNIYLLILSETGIVGFLVFIYVLCLSLRNIKKNKKNIISLQLFVALSIILFLGLFDHYFITLPQASVLFVLILSLSVVKSYKSVKIKS